ncbi:sulfotransferase domain-containing protein [Rossellomorea aquimaris]|uniref:sulfotransferase domain-containing protein n=1 Tax=Rossellomorea aquimaris TaxID=189382 RepID=UPI001CFCA4F6|nr:sulfotransferase domain-containing protein [Rossellomorea aquimaris]
MNNGKISMSPFIANSLPKSGTHLLRQILFGIPDMQHTVAIYGHYGHQPQEKLKILSHLSTNEFGSGHLYYSEEWRRYLLSKQLKQIFLYRDPRDVIVSYAHFIPKHKLHHLHSMFIHKTFEERIKFLLDGGRVSVNQHVIDQPPFREWYLRFSQWKNSGNVLSIRFEDLVCDEASKRNTILNIINYLCNSKEYTDRHQLIERMILNIDPKNSRTFRKGQIGSWKEELIPELKRYFILKTGTLVSDLGY